MVLNNSIMWGNVPNQIFANGSPIPSNVNITYSDIMDSLDGVQHIGNGSISWGQGNINQDPMFCDPDNGNNNLAENSPCVGTGENGANMGALGVRAWRVNHHPFDSMVTRVAGNLGFFHIKPAPFLLHLHCNLQNNIQIWPIPFLQQNKKQKTHLISS